MTSTPTIAVLGKKRFRVGIITMPSGNPAIALNHVGTLRPVPELDDLQEGSILLEFMNEQAVKGFFRDIAPLLEVRIKDLDLEKFRQEPETDTLAE